MKKAEKDIIAKYKKELQKKLGIDVDKSSEVTSLEYIKFKKELFPAHVTFYEKGCNLAESVLKIKPDPKKLEQMQEDIKTAHLQVTPTGVISFSLLGPIAFMLAGILLTILAPILFGGDISMFFIIFFLIAGSIMIFPLQKVPNFLANTWRLEASNQMVLCIFYVATYMRHTSNLERAIEFASNHLTGPLAMDLKKVIWDLETGEFSSVKDSLENYLKGWRKYNMEFIEAFHLLESSLYESSETRRIALLDKALDVILSETYEKMLHYAQNLKNPITTLHMLGIILPILGLVILPLIVSFLGGVSWYHIAILYNVTIPIIVYVMGKVILSKRPTGYGDSDISQDRPELKKYRNFIINLFGQEIAISPLYLSIAIGIILLFIGATPLIMHSIGFPDTIGIGRPDITSGCGKEFCLLDYREVTNKITGSSGVIGPFGLGAALISLCLPLMIACSFGLYYRFKSKNVIKIRKETKKLEKEFAAGLFQLGNRLGDGIPAEIAFSKVAAVMEGTTTGRFFRQVNSNITEMGMSVESAIFDKKRGALIYFPSKMIASSMKVLTESVKKGPRVAAQAVMNVARYIQEIHRVDERLKDLLSDIISSMKSQIALMTPAIAGIVIGITSMISNILGKLGPLLQSQSTDLGGELGSASVPEIFGLGIPPYYFQAVVGIYVVQIIFILTILSNNIENGEDKLNEKFLLGKNLLRSTFTYVAVAFIIMLIFNIIASFVLRDLIM